LDSRSLEGKPEKEITLKCNIKKYNKNVKKNLKKYLKPKTYRVIHRGKFHRCKLYLKEIFVGNGRIGMWLCGKVYVA